MEGGNTAISLSFPDRFIIIHIKSTYGIITYSQSKPLGGAKKELFTIRK